MTDEAVQIRAATTADADAIADVWLASFKATYEFPPAHSDADVRAWIRSDLAARDETFVAVEASTGCVVALMSLENDDLDQLYVDPGWLGRGIGSRLVELAKQRRPGGFGLYTFQVNDRARRFYERHGLVAAWFGDGSANEERQPDMRYEWRPRRTRPSPSAQTRGGASPPPSTSGSSAEGRSRAEAPRGRPATAV